MGKSGLLLGITLLSLLATGCTRNAKNVALVTLRVPEVSSAGPGKQAAPPTKRLACYAVSVTASDIVASKNPCGVVRGVSGGFVAANSPITLEVPRGSNRTFSVYLYLALEGETTCPSWDSNFEANAPQYYGRTYLIGSKTDNLTSDSATVTISASFPGMSNNVNKTSLDAGQCRPTGELRTVLSRGGDAGTLDATGDLVTIDFSAPDVSSIIRTSMGATPGYATSGSTLKFGEDDIDIHPAVHSITRKPDGDGTYFGLLEDGQVVGLNGEADPISYTADTCPFSTCTVPVWMESVAAGLNRNLYGKDHSGQIYLIEGEGEDKVTLLKSVPEYVSALVYY